MNEQQRDQSDQDEPYGTETGYEHGRSDEVDVEPGPRGEGAVAGTGAGRTGGLPGRGYHPEFPDDEADDTIGGAEPHPEGESRTEPYGDRLED